MPVIYSEAPDVERVATTLIADYHQHLIDVRIEYVFRSEAQEDHGKVIFGKARKVTGLNAWLAGDRDDEDPPHDFFVVEMAKDVWERFSPAQRQAAVDHELMHLKVKAGKLETVPHDFEGFGAEIRRHGLWRKDAEDLARAISEAGQQSLPLEEDGTRVTIHAGGKTIENAGPALRRAANMSDAEFEALAKRAAAGSA